MTVPAHRVLVAEKVKDCGAALAAGLNALEVALEAGLQGLD